MSQSHELKQKILELLSPFSSDWSGTLSKGDLVIPQQQLSTLVSRIAELLQSSGPGETSEREVFEALRELRDLPSLQDQASQLLSKFLISKR